jgi:arylsulfatase A
MNRLLLAIATLLLPSELALGAADSPPRPNVIVILADDLGWTDLACYGSDLHETPHLDRLAKACFDD